MVGRGQLPYATATAGDKALLELQKALGAFGCQSFGTMIDEEHQKVIVAFRWRNRNVQLEASWKGYAQAWTKKNPYSYRSRGTKQDHEQKALKQGRIAVCSVLRDWVKGQVVAVECGIMSFEAAFMPHMLLPTGERVLDRVQAEKLLPAPDENVVALPKQERA
jgi:hypothetical protein